MPQFRRLSDTSCAQGGLGADADSAWTVQGYLFYHTTVFGVASRFAIGYRALHQKYDRNNFKWDVTQQGPVIGQVFLF